MNDFELGKQTALEIMVDLALANMRDSHQKFDLYIGTWNSQKHTDWVAIKKANDLGFELWSNAMVASRVIDTVSTFISTRTFEKEREEIYWIYESLGSWDLYLSFGWSYENHKESGQ